MVAFSRDVLYNHPLDFRLSGAPRIFLSATQLREAIEWLADAGYDVVELDTSAWHGREEMHSEISDALSFPRYYGRNFDALNDCLGDVASRAYGVSPGATGLVLVLWRLDAFASVDRDAATQLLDVYTGQAVLAAQLGERMLCLVQSDDPQLALPPVGAQVPMWWTGSVE